METETKVKEQIKTLRPLEEKLALAKEMGLISQIEIIEAEIRQLNFAQKNIYPEVTQMEAQEAMCEKDIYRHGYLIPCRFVLRYQLESIQEWPVRCGKWGTHQHSKLRQKLKRETVGFGQEVSVSLMGVESKYLPKESTPLPMAAILRLKEAREKNQFDSFEVWRPETKSEEEARRLDPWLVGVRDKHYYKLCDWR